MNKEKVVKVLAYMLPDGTVGKVLDEKDLPDKYTDTWPAETFAETWWDEILTTGKGKRYLGYLATVIGDGRVPEWYVTSKQLYLALHSIGKLNSVQDTVKSLGTELGIVWDKSVQFNRFHPTVVVIAGKVGLSSEELDELWELAETL